MKLGLTAGRLPGWQADEIQVKFEILKLGVDHFPLCLAKVKHCFSKFNAFYTLFSGKNVNKV